MISASSLEMRGPAAWPASSTSWWLSGTGLMPGGEVGHQRDAEDFHACMAGGDGLERCGHAHQVGSDPLGVLYLRRRFVVRAGELRVDALVQGRVNFAGQPPDPCGVQICQVNERCAFERGRGGEVYVIFDEHGGAGGPAFIEAAAAVRDHQGLAACRCGRADSVHYCADALAFVVVRPGTEHQRALALLGQDGADGADVALDCRRGEAWDLVSGQRGGGLTDQVGGVAPA